MIKCDICKMNSAKYLVTIEDLDDRYTYKNTYRCEDCKEIAKRSHENITIHNVTIEKL